MFEGMSHELMKGLRKTGQQGLRIYQGRLYPRQIQRSLSGKSAVASFGG